MDAQSLSGKTPIGVARRTPTGIPIIAICGSLKDNLPEFPFENICAAFPIIASVESLEDTLQKAEKPGPHGRAGSKNSSVRRPTKMELVKYVAIILFILFVLQS